MAALQITSQAESRSARAEAFGYACQRCLRCCHGKHIQLNPYEVARLARNRGVSAADFRQRWTADAQGVALAQTDSGACVFLGAEGCAVHADRPLVCRLYPLGRHVSPDGSEHFSHMEPHTQSEGIYNRSGTIGGYLEQQGARPFMRAADDYFFWLCRAREYIAHSGSILAASAEHPGLSAAIEYLDLDSAVTDYCAARHVNEPSNIEQRRVVHLEVLDQLLIRWSAGEPSLTIKQEPQCDPSSQPHS